MLPNSSKPQANQRARWRRLAIRVLVVVLVALLGLLTALVNAHMPVGRPPLALAMRTAGRMALLGAPVAAQSGSRTPPGPAALRAAPSPDTGFR